MFYRKLIYTVLLFGGVSYSAELSAQELDSLILPDFDFVRRSEPWLLSQNPSGLKHAGVTKASFAEAFFQKSDGSFSNYHQSNNSYDYGLNAQSVYRLSNKVVLSGSFRYDSFKGRNMTGSAFIDPYQNPFDIVEMDVANRGDKELETYHLTGSASGQLSQKLSVGGKIDYQSANYAKTRDLRHINKLLDMSLSAGAIYRLSRKAEAGINYTYDRRIESISFRSYGNTDQRFKSLISFGAFFGEEDVFDEHDYTSKSNVFPQSNIAHGACFQLNLRFNDAVKLFNEFGLSANKGNYGEKGTNEIPFTEHTGNDYIYRGIFSVAQGSTLRQFRLDAKYASLKNSEFTPIEGTSTGGSSAIITWVKNERLDKAVFNGGLGYSLFKGISNGNPKWKLDLDAAFFRRLQTTTFYPLYRDQTLNSYQIEGKLDRRVSGAKRIYNLGVGLGFGSGSGEAKYDGMYNSGSSSVNQLSNMDLYLMQEFEYFTKPRVSGQLEFKVSQNYNRDIAPYLLVNYSYTRAFNTQYLGSNFSRLNLGIGCNF